MGAKQAVGWVTPTKWPWILVQEKKRFWKK
jgi:hypothetical protein